MISVKKLDYALLQQINHTNSKYLAKTDVIQRDYYLNSALDYMTEVLANLVENNDLITQHLKPIIIRNAELSLKDEGEYFRGQVPDNFYKPMSLYVIASKEGCSTPRRFKVRRPSSEKLQDGLKNPNVRRFWDFEETLATISSEGFDFYKEEGVTYKAYLDYIRRPKYVANVTGVSPKIYQDPSGDIIEHDQHLELDHPDVWTRIVSLAALNIKNDYSNFQEYQTQRDKLTTIERL